MKNYDLITPEGTRDLLFGECAVRRDIESRLLGLFIGCGYSEMITPGLEFYDVFNLNSSYFPQENMYKLTDNKGRLLVMRPDSTMPIARVVATRLKDAMLPLRLCYDQTVYRPEPALKGRSDEISQAGIELIGSPLRTADLEVISMAAEALSSFGLTYSLELGHIGIFKCLVSHLGVTEHDKETIRKLIETKNFPALNDMLDSIGNNTVTTALKKLPALFGGEEVFDKAAQLMPVDGIKEVLDELREIYCEASEICGENGTITVDLGLVNKTDYYTGLIIKGYLQGHGDEVISGGRYDKLISEFGYDVPAVGFGVNVNGIEKAMAKNVQTKTANGADAVVFAAEGCRVAAFKEAQRLRAQGLIVENALSDDLDTVREYAKEKKIAKVVVVNGESKEVEE